MHSLEARIAVDSFDLQGMALLLHPASLARDFDVTPARRETQRGRINP